MSRTVLLIAGAVTAVLISFASGYGYHRDERYFVAAGAHLDWAYADQGVLTPLIARAMSELAADSLTLLRLPSAVAAGVTVGLTGLLARELGGSRRAEAVAAACAAVAAIVLFTGHLLSTSTFDLLAWTAITWLAVRAVRSGDDRLWLIAGVVLGIGLNNKPLPAFLALGLLAGVVIAGPRRLLRNRHVWAGAGARAQRGRRRDDRVAGARADRRGRVPQAAERGSGGDPHGQLRPGGRPRPVRLPSACPAPTAGTTPTPSRDRRPRPLAR